MVFAAIGWKASETYAFALNQNTQNESPEAHSDHIWRQAAKMLKIRLLRFILAISGTRQPKCSKWVSWGSFWPYLASGSQNAQNETPEAHSSHIWLAISGARQPKCSKWWSLCLKKPKPRKLSTLKRKLHGFCRGSRGRIGSQATSGTENRGAFAFKSQKLWRKRFGSHVS